MNRRVLRNAVITVSVLAAVGVVTTLVRSGSPPSPIGRTDQNLSAGVHTLDLVALETAGTGPARLPKISITLPSGWRSYGGWVVQKFRGGKEVMAVSFWDVNLVYPTPCRWESQPMVSPGTTVASLASTLAKRPLRNATTPTNTALAGFRGRYLRWSVPKNIDFARCDQGYFESWTGLGWSSDRYEQGPGQVDRLWILNVEGQRLVVDATYLPAATANDRAELDRVVHSIKFLSDSSQRAASSASGGLPRSARSAHTVRLAHFVLPGRDTECQMLDPNRLDGYVGCAIHRNRNWCPGDCDVEWEASRRWYVGVTGTASVERSDRPLGAGERARVLQPGQTSKVGYLRCTSRAAGLTCVSRHSGHGFFLGKNNRTASGCAELDKLKAVFPAARAVGFTQRLQIMVQPARDPVYPGRCGAFWTTYKGPHGNTTDVSVTLYKASQDVGAALNESPYLGGIHRLSNGARVRTYSSHGSVNGAPSSSTGALSAFRKLFIDSTSISTSMTPVAISAQLRIHRHIENAFARLQGTH